MHDMIMMSFARVLLLLCLSIWSSQAGAMWLTNMLAYDKHKSSYWNSRVSNVLQIEHNLYRNITFNIHGLQDWSSLLRTRGIERLNHAVTLSDAGVSLDEEQKGLLLDAKNLSQVLEQLPSLEIESYAAHYVASDFLTKIEPNDTYLHEGLFQSYASLHDAYDAVQETDDTLKRVIFRVQGKTGKLADFIYQDHTAKMIWPMGSQFKVLKKEYQAERDLYFMYISELSSEERRDLSSFSTVYDRKDSIQSRLCQ